MPHSSGGGGSFSSSHSSSSSGGSNGPQIRKTYFPGSSRYVYYWHGTPRYYYADQRPVEATKKTKIFTSVFGFLFALVGIFLINLGFVTPKKLDDADSRNVNIYDNASLFTDTVTLKNSLQEFEDITGVTIVLLTINPSDWSNSYSNLEDYAYDKYVDLFKSNEKYWLIVFSVNPSNNKDINYEGMQGNDTDPILTESRTNKFNKEFTRILSSRNYSSVDSAFIDSLGDFNSYMDKYTDYSVIVAGVIWMLVVSGMVVAFLIDCRNKKGINDSYEISEDAEEMKCEYCGSSFVKGTVKKCPNCGASIFEDVKVQEMA